MSTRLTWMLTQFKNAENVNSDRNGQCPEWIVQGAFKNLDILQTQHMHTHMQIAYTILAGVDTLFGSVHYLIKKLFLLVLAHFNHLFKTI